MNTEAPTMGFDPRASLQQMMQAVKRLDWNIAFPKPEDGDEDKPVNGLIVGSGDFVEYMVKGHEDEWVYLINDKENTDMESGFDENSGVAQDSTGMESTEAK